MDGNFECRRGIGRRTDDLKSDANAEWVTAPVVDSAGCGVAFTGSGSDDGTGSFGLAGQSDKSRDATESEPAGEIARF